VSGASPGRNRLRGDPLAAGAKRISRTLRSVSWRSQRQAEHEQDYQERQHERERPKVPRMCLLHDLASPRAWSDRNLARSAAA
jgi:hypothetical protein